MSATDRHVGGYLLSIGLMAAGACALAITLKINFHFGSGLAVTEAGAELQGLSSLVVDVMAALLAVASGALLRSGRGAMGSFCLALTVCFGAYSLASAVGFGAAERMSLSESRKATAADASAKAKSALDMRVGYIEWLKRTTTTKTKDSKSLIEATSREIDKIGETKVVAPVIIPDAQARAFSHLIGFDESRIQLWLVVALATLLVTAKVAGFAIGSYVWPTRLAQGSEPDKQHEHSVPAANDDLPGLSSPVDIAAERHRRMVKRFLAEQTRPDPSGRVTATQAYNAFRVWTYDEGYVAPPTQAMFGRICGELGVPKIPGASIRYGGISLVEDKDSHAVRAA